ncbi:hypothetical protein PDESU_05535 [Pontiella desulfatans]|uniref:PEP-CTERM protein-sorting domain-containing protein n=1 Tax=Pontiella desulfatans TaxID=2750659 RepID=A0A6C2UA09_PONDE|nr:PEP-CTERM sorting domain-containing protein [Pontiella desulfatans]VGO16942.1 hypothetical protein PDESU_05535 [Pontiella desulfatans]
MKKTIVALIAVSGLLASANAEIIVNLDSLDVNSSFGTSTGTVGAVSVPLGGTSATHSFTVSGLDVAEDSTANDTVTFYYDVTAINGNIQNITGNAFSIGVDGTGDPTDHEIDPGEGLIFDNLTATVVFGDATTDTLVINSAAFTYFGLRYPGGGDVYNVTTLAGEEITTSSTLDGGSYDPYAFESPQSDFKVVSSAGGGFGVDTIQATFTLSVIPEPATLGLVSAFGGAVLFIRRRFMI